MMDTFKWIVCLFVSINAASTLDPIQHLQQEMLDMKNDYVALKNEYFASKEEQDRKIALLEGKVNSNEGNRQ